MRTYLAEAALLPQGWAENVLIEVEPSGNIAGDRARASAPHAAERIRGIVAAGHDRPAQPCLPAGAGRADPAARRGRGELLDLARHDVRFAQKITPEDQRAIAAQLYVELLKGGYTLGGRVPLPAPSARRPPIRRAGGHVAGDARGGAGGRDRADAAARGLYAGGRGRQPARRRAAPFRARPGRLAAAEDRLERSLRRRRPTASSASRCTRCGRSRTAAITAARGGGAVATRVAADPYPPRRAAQGGPRLPRAASAGGHGAARRTRPSDRSGPGAWSTAPI